MKSPEVNAKVETLIRSRALKVKAGVRRGQFSILCPFHADHNPSLDVRVETNQFICRSCQEHGNLYKLLVEGFHFTESQVLSELGEEGLFQTAGSEVAKEVLRSLGLFKRPEENAEERLLRDDEVLRLDVDAVVKTLTDGINFWRKLTRNKIEEKGGEITSDGFHHWAYVNKEGRTLGARLRQDYLDNEGKKGKHLGWVRLSFNKKTERLNASFRGFDKPYHFFGIHELRGKIARVFIVEGEKTASVLSGALKTWQSSEDRVLGSFSSSDGNYMNFDEVCSLLGEGVEVTLLPDNDDAGRALMRKIGREILARKPKSRLFWMQAFLEGSGDDVADFIATGVDKKSFETQLETYRTKFTTTESLEIVDYRELSDQNIYKQFNEWISKHMAYNSESLLQEHVKKMGLRMVNTGSSEMQWALVNKDEAIISQVISDDDDPRTKIYRDSYAIYSEKKLTQMVRTKRLVKEKNGEFKESKDVFKVMASTAMDIYTSGARYMPYSPLRNAKQKENAAKRYALNLYHPSLLREVACDEKDRSIQLVEKYFESWGLSEEEYRWVLKFMLETYENPQIRPHSSISLMSRTQGTGKSTFGYMMRELVGGFNYRHFGKDHVLNTQFNLMTHNILVAAFDEAFFSGNKTIANRVKAMVTEDTDQFEGKHMEAFESETFARYLFFSNHSYTLTPEPTNRRHCYIKVGDHLSGRDADRFWTEFLGPGRKKIHLHQHMSRFVYHLRHHLDLSGVDLFRPPLSLMGDLAYRVKALNFYQSYIYFCMDGEGHLFDKDGLVDENYAGRYNFFPPAFFENDETVVFVFVSDIQTYFMKYPQKDRYDKDPVEVGRELEGLGFVKTKFGGSSPRRNHTGFKLCRKDLQEATAARWGISDSEMEERKKMAAAKAQNLSVNSSEGDEGLDDEAFWASISRKG